MIHHYPLGELWLQLDTDTDHLCLVNALAAKIVQWQQQGIVGELLIQRLLDRYDVEETRLRRDVDAVLTGLTPPADVTFKDPLGYTPVVTEVPVRPLEIMASTILHLPGFVIQVDSEVAEITDALDQLFLLNAETAPPRVHLHIRLVRQDGCCLIILQGERDGECLDTGVGTADTVMKCLRCINLQCALALPGICFIHAAALSHGPNGLMLPARGGSGKSTLAASLVLKGYKLVNDDIVAFKADSQSLVPVPLAGSLKEGSWPVLSELWPADVPVPVYGQTPRQLRYWAPDQDQACQSSTLCSLVVVPQYSPNCTGHELSRLDPVELLHELLDAGISLDRPIDPAQLEPLCHWLGSVPAWRLEYQDLAHAHAAIEDLWRTVTTPATC